MPEHDPWISLPSIQPGCDILDQPGSQASATLIIDHVGTFLNLIGMTAGTFRLLRSLHCTTDNILCKHVGHQTIAESSGQPSHQDIAGCDELQAMSSSQGILFPLPQIRLFSDRRPALVQIKCDRALPACGVCQLYQRSCFYGKLQHPSPPSPCIRAANP